MALMDFFKQSAQTATQQQQQQQPQNQNIQQQPNIQQQQPGTGVANASNAGTNEPQDPLKIYENLFDNKNTQEDKAPTFSIDPKVMDQVVGSQDFTKGINPELFQKAMQGDQQAFFEMMNNVGRNAYRNAIEHGGMLTDRFVGAREAHSSKGLSGKVREELTTHALGNVPNFKNPVVKAQLTEVAKRLQSQHPDAAPAEIAEMAKDYITKLASALNPTDPKAQEASQNVEVDWNKFFE